jgi:hypothetical protein
LTRAAPAAFSRSGVDAYLRANSEGTRRSEHPAKTIASAQSEAKDFDFLDAKAVAEAMVLRNPDGRGRKRLHAQPRE